MAKTVHGVAALIENPKGELLVLLRQKNCPEPNVYGPPGGGLKFLETRRKACVREIFEETGLKVQPRQLIFLKTYNHQWQSDGFNIKLDVFSYRINGSNPQISIDPAEATDYIWETPQKLYARKDLLASLYVILKDIYRF